ncbi:MAG: hypothetical protein MUP36_04020 [Demequinaceae bacterium]|nr:hypothetical protein [Demequinaceae bacterium]
MIIVNNCAGKVTASAVPYPPDREADEDDARSFVMLSGSDIEPGSSFEDFEGKNDWPVLVSIQGESGEIWFQVFDLEDLKPVFELNPESGNCPG